jgi:hypothetical protein
VTVSNNQFFNQRITIILLTVFPRTCPQEPMSSISLRISPPTSPGYQHPTPEANYKIVFYDLLEKFGALTGTPVLLNTSFNIQGQPIIETPEDAIRCFYSTGMDALAMGNFLITKNQTTGTV